jgi:hypothetical protein
MTLIDADDLGLAVTWVRELSRLSRHSRTSIPILSRRFGCC